MNRRPLWPLLPPLAAAGAVAALLWFAHWLGRMGVGCFFYSLTGWHCPGCGGTRCAADLAAGNWRQALGHNALLTAGAAAFAAASIYLVTKVTVLGKPAPRAPEVPARLLWAGFLLIILFTVLRNMPAWPFTLLAP